MRNNVAWLFRENDLIPTGHRDPFVYLEASRVFVAKGRVLYQQSIRGQEVSRAYNFPALNTAVLLLGPGCSITSDAMELLCAANVVVGFTGSTGTPLSGGIEAAEEVHFTAGASEYRPTQYMQKWASIWFDNERKLKAAKRLLVLRQAELLSVWRLPCLKPFLEEKGLTPSDFSNTSLTGGQKKSVMQRGGATSAPRSNFQIKVDQAQTEQELLGLEGAYVKQLYSQFRAAYGLDFARNPQDRSGVNGKLTMGNYIAYGLAASVLYSLGISFAFPLLHGKTRRGGLVFDLADVLKDAFVIPVSFALRDQPDEVFRQTLKTVLMDGEGMRRLFRITEELTCG